MSDILSQDEIDSLLSAIGDDDEVEESQLETKNEIESVVQSPPMQTESDSAFSNEPVPNIDNNKMKNIDYLLDVKLPIVVEIGKVKMNLKTLLDFYEGVIFDLNKDASDSVQIKLNNKEIAKGEVIVADEKFGVRITYLISPEERVRSLA